ncbi:MAG: tetratricopeptide repeat protein [Bacteroidota bacterium]|nr:tetratricopeptide repeat protein [Bacteroidota bacterium]
MKSNWLFIVLLFVCNTFYGQSTKQLDSLIAVLGKSKEDTNKVNTLQKIAFQYLEDDKEKALTYLIQSKILAEQLRFKKGMAKAYLNIADILRLKTDYPGSKRYFLMSIAVNSSLKTNEKALAKAYNNLAMVYEELADNDSALVCYLASLKHKQNLKDTGAVGNTLLNIGVFYLRQSEMEKGREYFQKAIDYSRSMKDSVIMAKSYNNMALYHKNLGEYEEALKYNFLALRIKELTKKAKSSISSFENIGNIYLAIKDYKKAKEYYVKGLRVAMDIHSEDAIASVYSKIGLVFYEVNDLDSAEWYYTKAKITFEKNNDEPALGIIYNNLGNLYKDREDNVKAKDYIERSLEIDRKRNNRKGITSSLSNLGLVYGKLKDYRNAERVLKEAITLSYDINYLQGVKDASIILSKIYTLQNKFELALNYYIKHTEIKDSLLSENNLKNLNELETKYDTEKKEREILKLSYEQKLGESELKQQKEASQKRSIYFIFGISFVLIIAVLLTIGFIQKRKNNISLSQQKHLLEEKNKEITDSITYAKRLQQAILPPAHFIDAFLPDNFVFYKPKDIVAGDFYWMHASDELIHIAAADSTGHGVPGAMVSIVCSNAMDKAVKEFRLTDPGKILDKTTDLVLETFAKSGDEIKDGMDISLLCIDKQAKKIFWSGANNPLWFILPGNGSPIELTQIKADKQPIGKSDNRKPFTTQVIDYKAGTIFYLITDGYADQFGGPKGKKFKYKQLEELLLQVHQQPLDKQLIKLDEEFIKWKGNLEQVDDVTVMAIKI